MHGTCDVTGPIMSILHGYSAVCPATCKGDNAMMQMNDITLMPPIRALYFLWVQTWFQILQHNESIRVSTTDSHVCPLV